MADDGDVPSILLPCAICARTFAPESLEKHIKICEKSSIKKRKPFDSAKQRIQGTELEEFLPKQENKRPYQEERIGGSKSSWKQTHDEFLRAIRAARGEPAEISNRQTTNQIISGAPTRSNEKGICPTCCRQFGIKAYERHVAWCKERSTRLPVSPATNIAKERLEARIRYRAPALKNRRPTIREKYMPGSATNLGYTAKVTSPASSIKPRESVSLPNCNKSIDNSPKQKLATRKPNQSSISIPTGPIKSRPMDRANRLLEDSKPDQHDKFSFPSSQPVPPLNPGKYKNLKCENSPGKWEKSSKNYENSPPKSVENYVTKFNTKSVTGPISHRLKIELEKRSNISSKSCRNQKLNDSSVNNDDFGLIIRPCPLRKNEISWKQISRENSNFKANLASRLNLSILKKSIEKDKIKNENRNSDSFENLEKTCFQNGTELRNPSWKNRVRKLNETFLICDNEKSLNTEEFGNEDFENSFLGYEKKSNLAENSGKFLETSDFVLNDSNKSDQSFTVSCNKNEKKISKNFDNTEFFVNEIELFSKDETQFLTESFSENKTEFSLDVTKSFFGNKTEACSGNKREFFENGTEYLENKKEIIENGTEDLEQKAESFENEIEFFDRAELIENISGISEIELKFQEVEQEYPRNVKSSELDAETFGNETYFENEPESFFENVTKLSEIEAKSFENKDEFLENVTKFSENKQEPEAIKIESPINEISSENEKKSFKNKVEFSENKFEFPETKKESSRSKNTLKNETKFSEIEAESFENFTKFSENMPKSPIEKEFQNNEKAPKNEIEFSEKKLEFLEKKEQFPKKTKQTLVNEIKELSSKSKEIFYQNFCNPGIKNKQFQIKIPVIKSFNRRCKKIEFNLEEPLKKKRKTEENGFKKEFQCNLKVEIDSKREEFQENNCLEMENDLKKEEFQQSNDLEMGAVESIVIGAKNLKISDEESKTDLQIKDELVTRKFNEKYNLSLQNRKSREEIKEENIKRIEEKLEIENLPKFGYLPIINDCWKKNLKVENRKMRKKKKYFFQEMYDHDFENRENFLLNSKIPRQIFKMSTDLNYFWKNKERKKRKEKEQIDYTRFYSFENQTENDKFKNIETQSKKLKLSEMRKKIRCNINLLRSSTDSLISSVEEKESSLKSGTLNFFINETCIIEEIQKPVGTKKYTLLPILEKNSNNSRNFGEVLQLKQVSRIPIHRLIGSGTISDFNRITLEKRNPNCNKLPFVAEKSSGSNKSYDPFLMAEQQMQDLLSDTSDQLSTDGTLTRQNSTIFPPTHSSAFVTYPSQTLPTDCSKKRTSVLAPPSEFDDLTSDFSSDCTETNSISRELFVNDLSSQSRDSSRNCTNKERQSSLDQILGRRVIIDKSKALGTDVDDSSRGRSSISSVDKTRKILDKISAPKVIRPLANRSHSFRAASAPKIPERKNSSSSDSSGFQKKNLKCSKSSELNFADRSNNNFNDKNSSGSFTSTINGSNLSLNSSVSSDVDLKRSNSMFDELMSSFEEDSSIILPSLKSLLKSDPLSMSSPIQSNAKRNGLVSDDELSSLDSFKRQDHGKLSVDSAYSSLNRKYYNHGRSTNDMANRLEEDPPARFREGDSRFLNKSKMSKFCHECGSKFPESAKFCCECGIKRLTL